MFLGGVDKDFIGLDAVHEHLVARLVLANIGIDVARVRIQRQAQGNGTDAQHVLANGVHRADAGHPVTLRHHLALADTRHLRQGKQPEKSHHQGDQAEAQGGPGRDVAVA